MSYGFAINLTSERLEINIGQQYTHVIITLNIEGKETGSNACGGACFAIYQNVSQTYVVLNNNNLSDGARYILMNYYFQNGILNIFVNNKDKYQSVFISRYNYIAFSI